MDENIILKILKYIGLLFLLFSMFCFETLREKKYISWLLLITAILLILSNAIMKIIYW